MSDIKMFTATKAFITYNGKVLIIRESEKYKTASNVGNYDVVGGRVEPGQLLMKACYVRYKKKLARKMW